MTTATTPEEQQRAADEAANAAIADRLIAATRPTAHNVTGLVPVMCPHGALLVVDPDEAGGALIPAMARTADGRLAVSAPLADGRVVVRPRAGTTFIRAKYASTTYGCPIDAGQPRPDDMTTPAANRPVAALCSRPVRLFVPEVYDEAEHGPLVPA